MPEQCAASASENAMYENISSTRPSSSSRPCSEGVHLNVSAQSTVVSSPKKTEPMEIMRKEPSVPKTATGEILCSKKRTNARYSTIDTASLMIDSPYTSALSEGSTFSDPKTVSVATGSTAEMSAAKAKASSMGSTKPSAAVEAPCSTSPTRSVEMSVPNTA